HFPIITGPSNRHNHYQRQIRVQVVGLSVAFIITIRFCALLTPNQMPRPESLLSFRRLIVLRIFSLSLVVLSEFGNFL
ncbi:hypothetical protein, partial [uncultured Bifidobacterium sp.]|uniref:hypothetical protein n=1 Tax=uncultured Bifidobacterium sp. TaxID=165187 RepID=UPI002599461C